MNNEQFQQALENISEPMIEEAAQIYERAGYRHRRKQTILRVAAIAAVIAILMTALLWLDGRENPTPYFSVYVYANETDTVELQLKEDPILSNWDPTSHPMYDPDYSSSFGPSDSKEIGPSFRIQIELNDETRRCDDLTILMDGEKVDHKFGGNVFVSYSLSTETSKFTALNITGIVEKSTKMDIMLYDEDAILQHYTIIITPIAEGYTVVLDKDYTSPSWDDILSFFLID